MRAIIPVADWLTDTTTRNRSWFSIIGVPGLRRQVVLHAGLPHFDCSRPRDLSVAYRTPRWQNLADLADSYGELDDNTRCLLIFHLAQLSLTEHAFALAGVVEPTGDPDRDRYAYEVARVPTRHPDRRRWALRIFQQLAVSASDPLLALAACFQGIGHAMRDVGDNALAREFERRGKSLTRLPDDWYGYLIGSRFHRAIALLRYMEGRADLMRRELAYAVSLSRQLSDEATSHADRLVAAESTRYMLELQIRAACGGIAADEVRDLCARLASLDPNCVEARLLIGDALAEIGDLSEAAGAYESAGDLGTGSGAIGWFRAGQCYEILGERPAAIYAMSRCLELDATAVEPRAYLAKSGQRESVSF
jgi:tetratricopeptide (TPR) repeat protein